jgi:hypothetical protein
LEEGEHMIFFVALIPATMLIVAGYVVLHLAGRSEGALRSFGRYLGFWAFTLAALVVLGSFLAAAHGGGMHGCMMHGGIGEGMLWQCPVMHPWRHPMPGMGPAIPATPASPGAPGAAPPQ